MPVRDLVLLLMGFIGNSWCKLDDDKFKTVKVVVIFSYLLELAIFNTLKILAVFLQVSLCMKLGSHLYVSAVFINSFSSVFGYCVSVPCKLHMK
ncbi:hypothetical protein KP509_03G099600 [Ceratopteris richardii]|uniref:Uncharacterized protein n=1 Tax=Ceratopteris richardii TaxID=49495 RepID=A0A8T2V5M4_CERRI|nr:hypothetical protein KP509_03G099600 [Ceratopteris richardii]